MRRLIQKRSVSRRINPAVIMAVSEKMLKLIQEMLARLWIKILCHQSHQRKISSM